MKHDRNPGTFLTRLFGLIATGHKVRVDDVDRDDPDLFGVHGLGEGDLDFILAERTRRKHDDLMKATIPGEPPENFFDVAAAEDVMDEEDVARKKRTSRAKKINEILNLIEEIAGLAKKSRAKKSRRTK